jgi:hypothetical protein
MSAYTSSREQSITSRTPVLRVSLAGTNHSRAFRRHLPHLLRCRQPHFLICQQAGNYGFGVRSDDGFKLDTGPALGSTNMTLGIYEGGRGSDETMFSLVVGTRGLYPVRLLYYQGVGGADVEFYSFDPTTGARILVNDPANTNSIKAYRVAGYRMLNARVTGSSITFDVPTLPGKTITVEYKSDVGNTAWVPLSPTITGDGTIKTVSFPMPGTKGFFHLKTN